MSKISFVYFDVGGVVVKDFSDTNHWQNLKLYLGITANLEDQFDALYSQIEEKMCKGIDEKELTPDFAKKLGITLPTGFSFNKYIVDRFMLNPGIHPLIALTKKNNKIGMLTDMYKDMRSLMIKKNLFPQIDWDVILDSSELGIKKPMPEIYQLAKAKSGVPDDEILFIDNRQKNLDGAKQMGWQTYLYDSSNYDKSNKELAQFLKLNL